jgi:O-acetyl-ADP-ribose deacetylase (regulator of RNase III)
MSVEFAKGDIFKCLGVTAYAQGVNLAGAMGKGIALEFKARWPEMYEDYRWRCRAGVFRLGDALVWHTPAVTIFNLGTQESWKVGATLPAVKLALARLITLAEKLELKRVALPQIGAGLGGLPWKDIREYLCRIGGDTTVEMIVFEEFQPGVPYSPTSLITGVGSDDT